MSMDVDMTMNTTVTPNLKRALQQSQVSMETEETIIRTPRMSSVLRDADSDSVVMTPRSFMRQEGMFQENSSKVPENIEQENSDKNTQDELPKKSPRKENRRKSLMSKILEGTPSRDPQNTVDIIALTKNMLSTPELDKKMEEYELAQALAQPVTVRYIFWKIL